VLRRVEVVPHSPGWAAGFRAEADRLTAVPGDEVTAIHHIGSTAIPGISAKPIIDILLAVREVERLDELRPEMAALDYEGRGEFGLLGRRYFARTMDGRRRHQIHAYKTDNPGLRPHLAFRDYLIYHPENAQAYGRLKEDLAEEFPTGIEGYMAGKDAFIKETEKKAVAWSRWRRCM
jgi:GrpB-like predicted nucleotidyltransferase (UPF0157 family)